MNWEARRDQWHEMVGLGSDALLVLAWLYWCGADNSGLFRQSPDRIALDCAMSSRRRAIAALAKLSKTDDSTAPSLGELPALISYDFKHHIGYVHGWNIPYTANAPRNPGDLKSRLDFARRKPDCEPVHQCLGELAENHPRWDTTFAEYPLVVLYRELFTNTGAIMPAAADLRDGTGLRRALTEAWAKEGRQPGGKVWPLQEWRVHFQVVALNLNANGMFEARSSTFKCTLDWLVQDTTIAAARSKRPEDRRQKAFA